tara:strand:- start:2261 stop:3001 length:741 start_codon:yes stop_codon:yes gene_type:complete
MNGGTIFNSDIQGEDMFYGDVMRRYEDPNTQAINRKLWRRSNLTNRENIARKNARKNKIELERLKNIYSTLRITNPYTNMEKSLRSENLQVDKKQAEFQRDMFNQGQVNMLHTLRGVGGPSGTASLAQKLLTQGMIASRQASASIGEQEVQNKALSSQQAQRLQQLERSGINLSAQFDAKKLSLLMGHTQSEYALHKKQELDYYQAYANQKQEQANAQSKSMMGFFKGMYRVAEAANPTPGGVSIG